MTKINERYSYSEWQDVRGKTYYELWDYSRMHGMGMLRSPMWVAVSYNLNYILRRAKI